jgi:hypothetical protein
MAAMPVSVIRYRDRPELWQQITELSDEVWPQCNVHGEVIEAYRPLLYERFAEFKFVLSDEKDDAVFAGGQTIRCCWLHEWETWTGMRFPETGDYVFPAV